MEGLHGAGHAIVGEDDGAATMAVASPALLAMAASTIGLAESETAVSPTKTCEANVQETNAAAVAVPSIGQAAARQIATGSMGSGLDAAIGMLATMAGRVASSQG